MTTYTLQEIHNFEYILESGFRNALANTGAQIFDTASRDETAVSPRIEIKAVIGSYLEHRHQFRDVVNGNVTADAWDAYSASMEVTVITNRQDATETGDHRRLISLVRSKLLKWIVINGWNQEILVINDARPIGTSDTFVDDQDLDYTTMIYELVFNINPAVWPADLI